jgi:6-pyruvoyltetrahydropterin/6-carboxytetrahydropterin synthase
MYTISKDFTFDAAHRLEGVPEGHKCARDHGHTYTVRVTLQTPVLDDTGFVVDYTDLKALGRYIDEHFDHRHLNDVLDFNPTAEHLARHFYDWCRDRWPEVTAVSVSETPKTWATYSPLRSVTL